MSETVARQIIIDKLKAKYAAIKTANLFYTDLGDKVEDFRERSYFKDTARAINIRDNPNAGELSAEDESLEDQALSIEVSFFLKSADAATVRKGIVDIKRATKELFESDQDLRDIVKRIRPEGDQMDFEDEDEDKLAGATVTFAFEWQTEAFQEN